MNRYFKIECRFYSQTKMWRSHLILHHDGEKSVFWTSNEVDSEELAKLAANLYLEKNINSDKFSYRFPKCLLNYSGYN